MKKRLVFLLIVFCLSGSIYGKQWLVFFAKDGFFDGVLRQSFGHAYVGLIKEDTQAHQNVLLACWGFYPKGGLQTNGIVGFMDGAVKNDWQSQREHSFAVEISNFELIVCLQLKRIWERRPYSLRANNCLDFLKNYARVVSKIKMPKGHYLLPSTYLKALRSINTEIEYKGNLKNIIPKSHLVKLKKAKMYSTPKDHPDRKRAWFDFINKNNREKRVNKT